VRWTLRYLSEPGTEPVLSIDGAFGAPGTNLSHWPGNQTPAALKHELSTGIALNFVALPASEQARLIEGLTTVANNHYDTDGVLALFTILHPEIALKHREKLCDWARAGDFFLVPNEEAFCADHAIGAFADAERSPIAERLSGLDETQRYQVATEELMLRLPTWLASGVQNQPELKPLFQAELEALRKDQATLAALTPVPLVHFDLMVWESLSAQACPGRHALFEASQCDRVLWMRGESGGTETRLLFSTLSWFELPERKSQARPDLDNLVHKLNQMEAVEPSAEFAWRAQPTATASPELWFGRKGLPLFVSDASDFLAPSQLPVAHIKSTIMDALRDVWVFENETETSDLDDIYSV